LKSISNIVMYGRRSPQYFIGEISVESSITTELQVEGQSEDIIIGVSVIINSHKFHILQT
jgi:hypothetical protein